MFFGVLLRLISSSGSAFEDVKQAAPSSKKPRLDHAERATTCSAESGTDQDASTYFEHSCATDVALYVVNMCSKLREGDDSNEWKKMQREIAPGVSASYKPVRYELDDEVLDLVHKQTNFEAQLKFLTEYEQCGLSLYLAREKHTDASELLDRLRLDVCLPLREQLQLLHEVWIDCRELNSQLPARLARDIFKVSIKYLVSGDYVLNRKLAVERKSKYDLSHSVSNFRLFRQLTLMQKLYAQNYLLLEIRSDRDLVTEEIVQYHLKFPEIGLLWSVSDDHTARLFSFLLQKNRFFGYLASDANRPAEQHASETFSRIVALDLLQVLSPNLNRDLNNYKCLADFAADASNSAYFETIEI